MVEFAGPAISAVQVLDIVGAVRLTCVWESTLSFWTVLTSFQLEGHVHSLLLITFMKVDYGEHLFEYVADKGEH